MTDGTDEYGIKKPLDDEYIDVEPRRADISLSDEVVREHDESSTDKPPAWDAAGPTDDGTDRRVDERDGGQSPSALGMSHTIGDGAAGRHNGEWDARIDADAPRDHDGRAKTRTGFDPKESPDREKWRRLNVLNDDGRHPDRKQMNRDADKRRYVDTFAGRLDMTDYQQQRTERVVRDLDFSVMASYDSQQVVLAIVSIVANEDDRWLRDEDGFTNLLADAGLSMDDLSPLRQLVRRKSGVL